MKEKLEILLDALDIWNITDDNKIKQILNLDYEIIERLTDGVCYQHFIKRLAIAMQDKPQDIIIKKLDAFLTIESIECSEGLCQFARKILTDSNIDDDKSIELVDRMYYISDLIRSFSQFQTQYPSYFFYHHLIEFLDKADLDHPDITKFCRNMSECLNPHFSVFGTEELEKERYEWRISYLPKFRNYEVRYYFKKPELPFQAVLEELTWYIKDHPRPINNPINTNILKRQLN